MDYNNDIPKYRKKSTKKGKSRADHKHEYGIVSVSFKDSCSPAVHKAKVCKTCGYLNNIYFGLDISNSRDFSKYPEIDNKIYYINISDKFVEIER
jgi:ribosomal protein L32